MICRANPNGAQTSNPLSSDRTPTLVAVVGQVAIAYSLER